MIFAGFCPCARAQYFLIPDGAEPGHKTSTYVAKVDPQRTTFPLPSTDAELVYSKDFHMEEPVNIEHRTYRAAFGDPDKRNTCYPILLELGAGDPLVRSQDRATDHFTPIAPTGGIVLQEIVATCPNSLEDGVKNDDAFGDLVDSISGRDGLQRIASTSPTSSAAMGLFLAQLSPIPRTGTAYVEHQRDKRSWSALALIFITTSFC